MVVWWWVLGRWLYSYFDFRKFWFDWGVGDYGCLFFVEFYLLVGVGRRVSLLLVVRWRGGYFDIGWEVFCCILGSYMNVGLGGVYVSYYYRVNE